MDEDTRIEDGYQSDYPEPAATMGSTPYPSLQPRNLSTDIPSPAANNEDNDSDSSDPATDPTPSTARFTSLSEYFNLGSLPASSNRVQQPGPSRQVPWTNAFFNRHAGVGDGASSLPGYHDVQDSAGLSSLNDNQYFNSGSQQNEAYATRGGTRGRSGTQDGGRRRGWKWALKGTDHADLFSKPKTRARRGRGRAGRPRTGQARMEDPGPEFKVLQARATEAWLAGDYDTALECSRSAVQVNPEMSASYEMIHRVLKIQGHDLEALEALRCVAVSKRDPSAWLQLKDELLDLAVDKSSLELMDHAIMCCSEAMRIDKRAYEPQADRLELYMKTGRWALAIKQCEHLVYMRPGDLEMVSKYAELCGFENSPTLWTRAMLAYKAAFNHHVENAEFVDNPWDYLNEYMEVISKRGQYQEGVFELKRLARWFLGRKDDMFWDPYTEDDREFDITNERRTLTWFFQQGRVSRDNQLYGEGLPIDLRVKLGLFRLKMGSRYTEEGIKQLEPVLAGVTNTVDEGVEDLLFEVAGCFKSFGMFSKAIEYYEPIKRVPGAPNDKFWISLGQCYVGTNRPRDAEACYRAVQKTDPKNVIARVNLAKLYESMGESQKAWEVANEVTGINRQVALENAEIRQRKTSQVKPLDTVGDEFNETQLPRPPKPERRPKAPRKPARLQPLLPKLSNVATNSSRPELTNDHGSPGDDAEKSDVDLDGEDEEEQASAGRILGATNERRSVSESVVNLPEQRTVVHSHYTKVQRLWPSIEAGGDETSVQEWMDHASAMIAEFRKMKVFYPASGTRDRRSYGLGSIRGAVTQETVAEMEAIKKRSYPEAEVNEVQQAQRRRTYEFHGIPFITWHRIMSDLTLLYAKRTSREKCYEMLQGALMDAKVFQDDLELSNTTLALSMHCAMVFNDSELTTNIARQYMFKADKRSGMANQLLAATGRIGHGRKHFFDTKLQSWVYRVIKEQDHLAMPPELRKKYVWGEHTSDRLENRAGRFKKIDEELDAQLLTLYAHESNPHRKGNFHPSRPYLFRALALQPDNLVINLSIATDFIATALRRPANNQQQHVAEGLAFLYRYYDLRVAGGKSCHLQEAEYNVARTWHQMGLTHLAIPGYEKVLKLSAEVQQEHEDSGASEKGGVEDFASEAAYALQNIFALAGNFEAAQAITEEWLVL